MNSNRMTIVDKDRIKIDLEYNDKYVALHIKHIDFCRDTYLDMLVGISQLNDFIRTVGYEGMWAVVGVSDKKTQKLAERLGFHLLGESHGEYKGMFVYEYRGE